MWNREEDSIQPKTEATVDELINVHRGNTTVSSCRIKRESSGMCGNSKEEVHSSKILKHALQEDVIRKQEH